MAKEGVLIFDFTKLPKVDVSSPENIPMRDALAGLMAAAFQGVDKLAPLPATEDGYESTYEYCRAKFKEEYTDEVKQLMDSVDTKPVTIAISGNGTGKTHAAGRISVAYLLRFRQVGVQVYTACAPPEGNLKRGIWGEIGAIVQKFNKLFKGFRVSLAGMHIEDKFDVQNFIDGVTIPATGTDKEQEAKFSGKHRPIIVFVLDEGDAIPWAVYRGIESCLSGGLARLLIMFNPREQSGPVYQKIKNNEANVVTLTPFNHPNVITGENVIPGAVDRNTTGRRILRWSRPLGPGEQFDSECYTVPDYFEGFTPIDFNGDQMQAIRGGEKRRVTEQSFHYMVLARYPTQTENQLISRAWVERAQANWHRQIQERGVSSLRSVRPSSGLDVADLGADSNVLTFKHGSWMDEQETWGGVDPTVTADAAAEQCLNRRALYANVDSTGVGAGVPAGMKNAGFEWANRIMMASSPPEEEMSDEQKELGKFRRLRDYVWWGLREWLKNDPNAAIPPSRELEEDLLVATYEIKNGEIVVMSSDTMREKNKRSPDHGTSAGLAVMEELPGIIKGGEFGSKNYLGRVPRGTDKQSSVRKGDLMVDAIVERVTSRRR